MSKNLLKLFLFLWVFLLGTTTAWAQTSGYCGKNDENSGRNVTWSYDILTKTMTISGTGAMEDYASKDDDPNYNRPPWYSYRAQMLNLVIGEGVTVLGQHCFHEHTSLQNVTFHSGLETIRQGAFSNTNIVKLTFPNTLVDIQAWGLQKNEQLETVVLPASLLTIGNHAFRDCDKLSTVIVLRKDEPLTSLTENNQASQGTNYYGGHFMNCSSAMKIYVDPSKVDAYKSSWTGTNKDYSGKIEQFPDGSSGICGTNVNWILTGEGTNQVLTIYGTGAMDNYTAGNTPWKDNLTNIKIVQFADGVTSIGNNALNGCTNLTTLVLPNTLETIGESAVKDCTSLTSVDIPDACTSIGANAFENVHITTLTLPALVSNIGSDAFKGTLLTKVEVNRQSPATIGTGNVFPSGNSDFKIYVPAGTKNTYQTSEGWSTYSTYITALAAVVISSTGVESSRHETLSEALTGAATGSTVKLISDVTESVTFNRSSISLTLDLNNNVITAAANSGALTIQAGTLTIVDNAPSKTTRKWAEQTDHYWAQDANGTLTTSGGCITGGNVTGSGGGINVTGGTLTLNAGNIVGNRASASGGGIYFAGSTLNISGDVKIIGNALTSTGTPSNNLYLASDKVATITGAITGSDIGVTMAADTGVFTSGYASNGGASGSVTGITSGFHLDGGYNTTNYMIVDNNAGEAEIHGHTFSYSNPEVYQIKAACSVKLADNTNYCPEYANSKTYTLAVTDHDTVEGYPYDGTPYEASRTETDVFPIYDGWTQDAAVTYYKTENADETTGGVLQESAPAGVGNYYAICSVTKTSDNTKVSAIKTFTIVAAIAQIGETNYPSVSSALDAAIDGQTVKLLVNWQESINFNPNPSKSVTLDLNNYVITAAEDSRTLLVNAGTLTIVDNAASKTTRYWEYAGTAPNDNKYWTLKDDQTAENNTSNLYTTSGGCITGGNVTTKSHGGGIYVAAGATLNLNAGNVVGNRISTTVTGNTFGGGVFNEGTLVIGENAKVCGNVAKYGGGVGVLRTTSGGSTTLQTGSSISYNYATQQGGGFYAWAHASSPVVIKGSITYNTSNGSGGGVQVFANQNGGWTNLTLDGATITNNTAVNTSAGAYIDKVDLTIKGEVTINNNTLTSDGNPTRNLFLTSGKAADISGISAGSQIGITLESTTGTFTKNNTDDSFNPTTIFSSDRQSEGYYVLPYLNDSKQAQIYACEGDDDNIHWKFEVNQPSEGKNRLTISRKSGITTAVAMPNYMCNDTQKSSSNFSKQLPWLPLHSFITDLVISGGVTTVGAGCCSKWDGTKFVDFTHLTNVTLPEGITKIDQCAFRACTGLTTIDLPSTLTAINANAFQRTGLTSVAIPATVTSIGNGAFQTDQTATLTTFVLMRTSSTLTSLGTSVFNGQTNVNIYVPNSKVSNYKAASNWSTYSSKIKGWTYRLSGGTSGNATLTLNSTSEEYNGSAIEPSAQSLVINANADVPLYDTETTPAQLLSLTHKFSTTDPTLVDPSNYTLSYTEDHISAGTKTATATTVANKDYSFATEEANLVKADYTITKKLVEITANDQTVNYGTSAATVKENATISGLLENHTLDAVTLVETAATGSQTQKTIVPSAATIKNGETDVTANYEITYTPGTLTEQVNFTPETDWSTYYFSVTGDNSATTYVDFAGEEKLKVYTVKEATATNVIAEEQSALKANVPYLLKKGTGFPDGGLKFDVKYGTVSQTYSAAFVRSDGTAEGSANANIYVLSGDNFVWARSGTIAENKCYLDLGSTPATARKRVLNIIIGGSNDGSTAIEGPELTDEEDGNEWYDLQGRKLEGKPMKKGLYIKNGHKVVIK